MRATPLALALLLSVTLPAAALVLDAPAAEPAAAPEVPVPLLEDPMLDAHAAVDALGEADLVDAQGLLPVAGVGVAAPAWAPLASATIRPGVQTVTNGGQCTSNFVFYTDKGNGQFDIYLGQAAHCGSLGSATQTNGCTTPSVNIGTSVTVRGAQYPGTLAYSSWKTMQAVGESNPSICAYNDFALVKLDPRDHGRVNPSMLNFGGPTGYANVNSVFSGSQLVSFQNSGLRPAGPLSWKEGVLFTRSTSQWQAMAYFVTPGIPGDSGSGVITCSGAAYGIVVTLSAVPNPGSNGMTDIKNAVGYAASKAGISATLGTAPRIALSLPPCAV